MGSAFAHLMGFPWTSADVFRRSLIETGRITRFQSLRYQVESSHGWNLMGRNDQIEVETRSGERIPILRSPFLIGRATESHLRFPVPDVSRRHAILAITEGVWWLMDMGSRSGTWLNGSRLHQAAMVEPGDVIGLGSVSLKLHAAKGVPLVQFGRSRLLESTHPGETEWVVTRDTKAIWVDGDFQIRGGSPDTSAWLAAFYGEGGNNLPKELRDWLGSRISERMPHETRVGDERLRVTLCEMQGDERLLVLSRLSPAFTPESAQKLGLTKAEALVVPWLIRGRRNEEIGMILGISSRTAEKHIAGILEKLEVETRTAAVWNIIERSGAHR
jgi:pSer/pThr/pTyr-binding forkhead associated (FHA) protein/DNA-binding CsgD family transcriptional regulator